jgi:hypothetical protein
MSVGVSKHRIGGVSIGVVTAASSMFELTLSRKDGVTGVISRTYWKQQENPFSHLTPKRLKGMGEDTSVLSAQSQGALAELAPIYTILPRALMLVWTGDATERNADD